MDVVINADEERLKWRDNLLTKYEERIRKLEKLLGMANYYVLRLPQTELLIQEIQETLSEGRTKEGRKDGAQNSNRDVCQQGGTGSNSS